MNMIRKILMAKIFFFISRNIKHVGGKKQSVKPISCGFTGYRQFDGQVPSQENRNQSNK